MRLFYGARTRRRAFARRVSAHAGPSGTFCHRRRKLRLQGRDNSTIRRGIGGGRTFTLSRSIHADRSPCSITWPNGLSQTIRRPSFPWSLSWPAAWGPAWGARFRRNTRRPGRRAIRSRVRRRSDLFRRESIQMEQNPGTTNGSPRPGRSTRAAAPEKPGHERLGHLRLRGGILRFSRFATVLARWSSRAYRWRLAPETPRPGSSRPRGA